MEKVCMTSPNCTGCGSFLTYSPTHQKLCCTHCGSTKEITSKPAQNLLKPYSSAYAITQSPNEDRHYECATCGSVVIIEDDQPKRCPSCGDHSLTEKRKGVFIPDGLLPFTLSPEQATSNFKNWIKKRKFAPTNLKKLARLGKISGMFVPAWSHNFTLSGSYLGEVSWEEQINKDKSITRRRSVSGPINETFNDVYASGSTQVSSATINALAPFLHQSAQEFASEYLLGFSGLDTDENAHTAHSQMIQQTKQKLENDLRSDLGRGKYRVEWLNLNVIPQNQTLRYLFVPIYASHYTYKKKKYHTYINGQTGTVTGKAPKSFWKIFGLVVGIVALVAGLAYLLS